MSAHKYMVIFFFFFDIFMSYKMFSGYFTSSFNAFSHSHCKTGKQWKISMIKTVLT